jgi:hypothetical protein
VEPDQAVVSDDELDSTWAVVGHGTNLLVGPWRALRHSALEPRVHVTLLAHDTLVPGRQIRSVPVRESGVRDFDVLWSEGDNSTIVASNPAGGNKIAWSADQRRFWLTPARDAHLSSVHVRFVLRHLTTVLLGQDLAARAVHAVVGSLMTGGALAVCGPTRSGKTRLVNRLLVDGVLDRVVDDDCPVLAAGARLHGAVPARYEIVRAWSIPLAGLILLDDATTSPREMSAVEAEAFLLRTPRPWPAPWLPNPDQTVAGGSLLPTGLPVLALPMRDDGEADHRAVTERIIPRLAAGLGC